MAEKTVRNHVYESKQKARIRREKNIAALSTLAGGMAHNFNNLLMGIQANISLIAMETHSSHPHYQRLKAIENLIRSGAEINTQLLGYAREGTNEFKSVDLGRLVKDVFVSDAEKGKRIKVHRDIANDLHEISADHHQIEQALKHIFANAVDAMPGGGDLFMKMENVTHKEMTGRPYEPRPGRYVLLTVKDTGIGMDSRTLECVFDPFYTTKGVRGTGLGLSFVYGIIKAHNGYIDVFSKKSKGTSFKIYLPAFEAKPLNEKDMLTSVLRIKESDPTEDNFPFPDSGKKKSPRSNIYPNNASIL